MKPDTQSTFRSEQDVRECVIRPLLDRLGYTPSMVTTELPLIYRYRFLGRKKGQSIDRPLRGQADYIVDVDNLRWVIEAKKPGEITDEDREQAYSYAQHSEVRAVIFAVISGTHFEFHRTSDRPEAGPILAYTWEQREGKFELVRNLVAPDALKNHFPDTEIDTRKPLALGLRSFAKVEVGTFKYK